MSGCPIERRIVVTRGTLNLATGETTRGESKEETRPCGTPLFGQQAERGICRACSKLWEAEGSTITPRGLAQIADLEREGSDTARPGAAPRCLDWSDERGIGNPIMVTLIRGYAFEDHSTDNLACHVRGFDTVREAERGAREAAPCRCNRCRGDD